MEAGSRAWPRSSVPIVIPVSDPTAVLYRMDTVHLYLSGPTTVHPLKVLLVSLYSPWLLGNSNVQSQLSKVVTYLRTSVFIVH